VRAHGIRVCALCPGQTMTEFQEVAGQPTRFSTHGETAEKVARVGLKALARGRTYAISGVGNYLSAHAQRLVPRQFVTRMAAKMMRPSD
jgi:short-subunit dehydrogenase